MARGAQALETYLVTSSTGAAADAPEDDNVSYSV
jgi:hypothetical protein